MMPRYDGYYRCDFHDEGEMHAGVWLKDVCYRCLKLYDDGLCICKTYRDVNADFLGFLAGLDLEELRRVWPHEDPVDDNYNALYRSSRFVVEGDRLLLNWAVLSPLRNGTWMKGQ